MLYNYELYNIYMLYNYELYKLIIKIHVYFLFFLSKKIFFMTDSKGFDLYFYNYIKSL